MSFLPTSLPSDVRVLGVAVKDASGKLITLPRKTVLEKLGGWSQHSSKRWELDTALILGLEHTKGGAFEVATFCFKQVERQTLLTGKVLGTMIYREPVFGFSVLSVFASVDSHLWAFVCGSELYNEREAYPVRLCEMEDKVTARSFDFIPHGQDLGLKHFCQPKASVVTEVLKVSEPEKPKVVTLTPAHLAKLGKRQLKLGGEKEHSASFYCDKVIPRCIEEAFVAGSQLGLLEVEVKNHLDQSLLPGWRKELDQAMMSLLAFGEKFLPKTDIPAKFQKALYPHHKPAYSGKKLVPQLVETLVKATAVLDALPDEMKPLVKDSTEANLAGKVSAAVAGIHKFVPLLSV